MADCSMTLRMRIPMRATCPSCCALATSAYATHFNPAYATHFTPAYATCFTPAVSSSLPECPPSACASRLHDPTTKSKRLIGLRRLLHNASCTSRYPRSIIPPVT